MRSACDWRLPATHHGQPVAWGPFRAPTGHTAEPAECESCGTWEEPVMAWGSLLAHPGQAFPRAGVRARLARARALAPGPVLSAARLAALRCPVCRVLRVYDRGAEGEAFDPVPLPAA